MPNVFEELDAIFGQTQTSNVFTELDAIFGPTTDPEANGLSKVIDAKDLEAEAERQYQAETEAYQKRKAAQAYAASPQGQAEELRQRWSGMNPIARTVGTGALSAVGAMVAPVMKGLEAIDPSGVKSDLGANMERTIDAIDAEMAKEDPSWLARQGRGVVRSGVQGLITSAMGGVPAMIAAAAVTGGSQDYTRARDKGLSPEDAAGSALRKAGAEGLITALFSRFGAGGLESLLGGLAVGSSVNSVKSIVKDVFKKTTIEELPENIIIWGLKAIDDYFSGVDPDALKIDNVASNLGDIIAQTAGMGAVAGVSRLSRSKAQAPETPNNINTIIADVVNNSPDLASKIASQPTMSRSEYENITGIKKSSKSQREAFQQQVREAYAGVSGVSYTASEDQSNIGGVSIDTPIKTKPNIKTMGSILGGEVEADAMPIPSGKSNGQNAVTRWLKTNFTGDLPKQVFERNLRREGAINAHMTGIVDTQNRFEKVAKGLSEDQRFTVNKVLNGDLDIDTLPENLRPLVAEMRDHVDAMSRELIREGVVQGKMAATVEANAGTYLNRSYRVFTDKNWAKKIAPEEMNRAVSALRAEMPEATQAEIDGMISHLLSPGDSPMAALSSGKLGSKNLAILKHRQDIPVWLRRLWGEETDPVRNYVGTVIKQSKLLENHKFLKDVKQQGMGKYLFDRPIKNEQGDYSVQLGKPESGTYSPVAGLYTTKEIADALQQQRNTLKDYKSIMAYLKAVSFSKQAKTSLNFPMGHVRNFLGNTLFEVANGRVSLTGSKDATIAAFTNDADGIALVQRLQKLGLLDGGVEAGQLMASIRDARTQEDHIADVLFPGRGVGASVKKVANAAGKSYQAVDNWWKVKAFMHERASYAKAYPEWTPQQLDSHVAGIIRDTTPSFSMLPEIIKKMRAVPVLGTFTSFPSEVVRTTGKTLALTKKELSDPKTRAIGARRLAGIMAAAAIPGAISAASRYLAGVDKEDEDDLRRFVAPWIKNSTIVWIGKGQDGMPSYIDLSFMDPYKYLRDPINAMLSGKTSDVAAAVEEAASPWLSENMMAAALLDVARNKRSTNERPIYNKMDSVENKTRDIVKRIWEAMEPGSITQGRRVYSGITGKVSESGRKYDPTQEVAGMMGGTRMQTIDIPQSLYFKGAAYSRDKVEATRLIQSKLSNRGEVSPEEILEARKISELSREELFKTLVEDIAAAQRLGVSKNLVFDQLRSSGMSLEEAQRVMRGTYQSYTPRRADQRMKLLAAMETGQQ